MELVPTLAWLASHFPILAMTVNAVIELRLSQVRLWWEWHLFTSITPLSSIFCIQ